MDLDMYAHPTTQKNIEILQSFGHTFIEAQSGELASGLCGAGRMQEPEEIVEILVNHFKKKNSFEGKSVIITAGPTQEAIDPVRFIGNYSSGKMGYAIAHEFAERGAKVSLISGPVYITIHHPQIKVVKVKSGDEMFEHVNRLFEHADIAVFSAAVADYRPKNPNKSKIKKKDQSLSIELEPTIDILKTMGQKKKDQFVVGFALETDNEVDNAQKKLIEKNCDAIVLNSMQDAGAGFGHQTNKISILGQNRNKIDFELKDKKEVAIDICEYIEKALSH
jgi:phosphopantothenoylcysteine decarboxylase/phosphopantothenate--cysteine ligase